MNARAPAQGIAYDVRAFCAWFRSAGPGETCIYHSGNLATDRVNDEDLAALADTVNLLRETEAVGLRQFRQQLPIVDVWCYIAIRNRGGFAPRSIINLKLSSTEYRALQAIRDRDPDISVTRAIRDTLTTFQGSSDDLSVATFNALRDRNLVEEAPGKGWQLSAAGIKAMT